MTHTDPIVCRSFSPLHLPPLKMRFVRNSALSTLILLPVLACLGFLTLTSFASMSAAADYQPSGWLTFDTPGPLTSPDSPCTEVANATIGVVYSSTGLLAPYSKSGLVVAKMYVDGVNRQCGIGGLGFRARVVACDIKSDNQLVDDCVTQLMAHNLTSMLVAEGPLASVTATAANAYNIPLIAGMSGTKTAFVAGDGSRAYSNMFGVLTPASEYMAQFVAITKMNRMQTMAVVSNAPNFISPDSDVCDGAIAFARDSKMTVVFHQTLSLDEMTPKQQEDAITAALLDAQATQPDVLVTCLGQQCSALFSAMHRVNFNPKAHGTFECVNKLVESTTPQEQRIYAQYAFNPSQWNANLTGREYQDESDRNYANLFPPTQTRSSSEVFYDAYVNTSRLMTGDLVPFTSLTAGQMAGFYRLDYGIARSGTLDGPTLVRTIQTMNTNSFFGFIGTDERGENSNRDIPQVQAIDENGNVMIVYPLLNSPILPMPSFAERIYDPVVLSDGAEKAMVALACIITACAAVLAAFVFKYRDFPDVKSQSVPFSMIFICGCVLLVWAPASWLLYANASMCRMRLPIWILAFVMMMGPVTVTAFRIYFITHPGQDKFKFVRLGNGRLFLYMLGLASGHILLVIISLAADILHPSTQGPDAFRPSHNFTVCALRSGWIGVCYALIAVTAAFLGFPLYYAWHIRKLRDQQYERFNNARLLSILVFLFVLSLTMGCLVQFGLSDGDTGSNRRTKFIIMFLLSDAISVLSLGLYFVDPLTIAMSSNGLVVQNPNMTYIGEPDKSDSSASDRSKPRSGLGKPSASGQRKLYGPGQISGNGTPNASGSTGNPSKQRMAVTVAPISIDRDTVTKVVTPQPLSANVHPLFTPSMVENIDA